VITVSVYDEYIQKYNTLNSSMKRQGYTQDSINSYTKTCLAMFAIDYLYPQTFDIKRMSDGYFTLTRDEVDFRVVLVDDYKTRGMKFDLDKYQRGDVLVFCLVEPPHSVTIYGVMKVEDLLYCRDLCFIFEDNRFLISHFSIDEERDIQYESNDLSYYIRGEKHYPLLSSPVENCPDLENNR